jgi:hypothetical protein
VPGLCLCSAQPPRRLQCSGAGAVSLARVMVPLPDRTCSAARLFQASIPGGVARGREGTVVAAMGSTKSREVIWGGQIGAAKINAEHARQRRQAKQPAKPIVPRLMRGGFAWRATEFRRTGRAGCTRRATIKPFRAGDGPSRGGKIRRKALLVTAERKLRYRTRLHQE